MRCKEPLLEIDGENVKEPLQGHISPKQEPKLSGVIKCDAIKQNESELGKITTRLLCSLSSELFHTENPDQN